MLELVATMACLSYKTISIIADASNTALAAILDCAAMLKTNNHIEYIRSKIELFTPDITFSPAPPTPLSRLE